MIKAAYRSVGKLVPFKTREDRPRFNDTSPYYAMPPPAVPIAPASMMAPRPVSTDGIRPRPGMQLVGTTREQFNDYLQMYMTEQSLSLSTLAPAREVPGFATGRYGTSNRATDTSQTSTYVTCYNCGQRSHDSNSCTNRPLSAEEQYKIRLRVAENRRYPWHHRRTDSLPARPFPPADQFPQGHNQDSRDSRSREERPGREPMHCRWYHMSQDSPRPRMYSFCVYRIRNGRRSVCTLVKHTGCSLSAFGLPGKTGP